MSRWYVLRTTQNGDFVLLPLCVAPCWRSGALSAQWRSVGALAPERVVPSLVSPCAHARFCWMFILTHATALKPSHSNKSYPLHLWQVRPTTLPASQRLTRCDVPANGRLLTCVCRLPSFEGSPRASTKLLSHIAPARSAAPAASSFFSVHVVKILEDPAHHMWCLCGRSSALRHEFGKGLHAPTVRSHRKVAEQMSDVAPLPAWLLAAQNCFLFGATSVFMMEVC